MCGCRECRGRVEEEGLCSGASAHSLHFEKATNARTESHGECVLDATESCGSHETKVFLISLFLLGWHGFLQYWLACGLVDCTSFRAPKVEGQSKKGKIIMVETHVSGTGDGEDTRLSVRRSLFILSYLAKQWFYFAQ